MAKTAKIVKTNTIEFQFPFNRDTVERIKKLSGRKYVADRKVWQVTLDFRNCFEVERIINELNFFSEGQIVKLIDEFKQEAKDLIQGKGAKVDLLPIPERVQKSLDALGFSMRPYQIEGFSSMVKWRMAINGCEMGLGKTLQTLVAVEYLDAYPSIVICPASLKYNWQNEINRFLVGRTVKVVEKAKDVIYGGSDFYIINYDIVSKKLKDLERIGFKSSIADESHYIKNKKAQRSKAAAAIIKKTPNRFLLSGTIVENRPAELLHQIEVVDQLTSLGGYWEFINRYCDAKSNGFGLDLSGAKNTEELFMRMSRSFYFRRNKADVLKELPPKIYNTIHLDITNRKEYNYAEKQLTSYLQDKVLKAEEIKQQTKGMSAADKKEFIFQLMMEQEDKVSAAEHLVLMTTLRKVSAQGKIEPIKEWVNNFLGSSNEKILIFAWHTEMVLQLAKEFKCQALYGGVDGKKRQEMVDEFQNDPTVRVLVLNIKAGGVGLNLTKSSTVLFVEEPYNPALKLQAEDRAHRIGQKDTVNVVTAIGRDTIDEDIHSLIQEKLIIVNAINAGKFSEEQTDLSIMKELLKKLAEK